VNTKTETPINKKKKREDADILWVGLSIFLFADHDTRHSKGGGRNAEIWCHF
jgi:hypothetical protein